jgi:hypothetical protein
LDLDTGECVDCAGSTSPSDALIDMDCNPVEGAVVEVWYCDKAGIYSADTSESDDSSRFAEISAKSLNATLASVSPTQC